MTKRATIVPYGWDIEWREGDTALFLIYNRLCGEQAKHMAAWDRAKMAGRAEGERPAGVPARELYAVAAAELSRVAA